MDLDFWAFHAPNFLLAAMIYTVIARYVLSLFFRPDSDLVIWRVFCQITNPVLHAVRVVTPAVVPGPLVMVLAVVWLILLRVALFFTLRAYGLVPGVGGAG